MQSAENKKGGARGITPQMARFALDHAPDTVFWLDEAGHFIYTNERAAEMLHYSVDSLLSMFVWDVDPNYPPERWREHWADIKTRVAMVFQTEVRREDGELLPVEVHARHIEMGGKGYYLAFLRDISERLRGEQDRMAVEARLWQAQKMESLGRMAGGIAHDFNNLLTPIVGFSEMALQSLPPNNELRSDLQAILDAARRGQELTRQILALSRRQVLTMRSVDVNAEVQTLGHMLQRVMHENIRLVLRLAPQPARVRADASQLHQTLVQLVLNACDAMPEGGTLTLEVELRRVDSGCANGESPIPSGDYVCIRVSDTGRGMDEETRAHLFEPFYTRKDLGGGVGLGLATVYGIVKQHGGFIAVDTAEGRGTTFEVLLPAVSEETQPEERKPRSPARKEAAENRAPTALATVLVADDEEAVRKLITRLLASEGLSVLTAADAEAALAIAARHAKPIDLLVTNVMMPACHGPALYRALRARHPETRVLYISGFSRESLADREAVEDCPFLEKPFSAEALLRAVRAALAAPAPAQVGQGDSPGRP